MTRLCSRGALAAASAGLVLLTAAGTPPRLAAVEPGASGEPELFIARLSVTIPSLGPGTSDRQFQQALQDTPAQRESRERMAAVLAGEVSLYEARQLRGQARLDFLERAARRGDAAAATAIGNALDSGDGIPADAPRARSYFRAGAIGGRMEAAHNLGADCARGRGGSLDFTEALAWLRVARLRGDRSGAEQLLREHLQVRGRSAAIAAAEQRAQQLLVRGTAEEVAAALPPSAALNYDPALALRDDVPAAGEAAALPDEPAAPPVVVTTTLGERRAWPSLAALEGAAGRSDPAAMGALGRLLASGKLLPRDPMRAIVWLERSAAAGDVDAAQQLGDLYSGADGVVADDARAFTYFTQAAHGGSALAMASLGIQYTNGRGTQRDWVRGLAWLIAAKSRGVDLGHERQLRTFLAQHHPEDIPNAEGLAQTLVTPPVAAR